MNIELFDLLKQIRENGSYSQPERKTRTRDIAIEDDKVYRMLEYLNNLGMVTKFNEQYIISEYGYTVSSFSSWEEYLNHYKNILDKKVKKENLDLKLTEFQTRTKLLPYFISFASIIISIFAISYNPNTEQNQITPQKTEVLKKSKVKDTVSHTKKVHLDTVKSSHKSSETLQN